MEQSGQFSLKRRFDHSFFFGLLLLAFVLVAGWYALAIPPGEGVDEVPHFQYVRFVKENRALPVQPWQDNGRAMEVWMGHHPPLYYAVLGVLCAWCDMSDASQSLMANPHFVWSENDPTNGWNVVLHPPGSTPDWGTARGALVYLRLWSVLFGAILLVALYRVARIMLPAHPWIAMTAVALIAFNPSFLFMSSTVHHDVLMAMIYALAAWWMVRTLTGAPSRRDFVLGGLLLGAAMLTKLSGLNLAFAFGLTLALLAYRERRWRDLLQSGVLLFGVAVAVAGWWYARNQLLYGDLLGWDMFLSTHNHMVRQGGYSWFLFRYEFLEQLARTFWGAFGYMHITLPSAHYLFFWRVAAVATAATCLVALFRWRTFRSTARWQSWLVLLVTALLLFVSFVRFSMATTGAGHGRYLFTAAATFSLIIAVGLHALVGFRLQRFVTVAVSVAMLAYAIYVPQIYLLPLYSPPETAQSDALSDAAPANILFGDVLELVAFGQSPQPLQPGQSAELVLFWRAHGEARPDLYTVVRLLDRYGNVFAESDFWPVPSLSTIAWDNETIYLSRATYYVPPNVALGPASLDIMVQPGREGEPLAAQDSLGTIVGSRAVVDSFLIGQESTVNTDSGESPWSHSRSELLGEAIALAGYTPPAEPVEPGQTLDLQLFWRAEREIDRNFTVFVQLLDEQGALVAQQDNEPNRGQFPTSLWQPGEVVADPYALMLPDTLAPGAYRLIVGMYEWPSLARLPVTVEGATSGDFITLDPVIVGP